MKPVITIRDGAVDAHSRQRSRARALEALRSLPLEAARGKSGLHLAVMHAACEEEARALAEDLRTTLKPQVFLFGEMGPALGTYTGPGGDRRGVVRAVRTKRPGPYQAPYRSL